MPVIREYFYLLKQAVLTGDPNLLFSRYHDLATGTDREKGINTEAQHIASMQSLSPFDGNIALSTMSPSKSRDRVQSLKSWCTA
jgi:hypothetical protein